jgi:hypothetical protein
MGAKAASLRIDIKTTAMSKTTASLMATIKALKVTLFECLSQDGGEQAEINKAGIDHRAGETACHGRSKSKGAFVKA